MSETEALPVSRRPEPPEWEYLTTVAKSLGDTNVDDKRLSELVRDCDALDMTALDANRYYAFGHAVCESIRILNDKEERAALIDRGAQILLGRYFEEGDFSALSNPLLFSNASFSISSRAVGALPGSTQDVGDLLCLIKKNRLGELKDGSLAVTRNFLTGKAAREQGSTILTTQLTHDFNNSFLAGATTMARRVLRLRLGDLKGTMPTEADIDFIRQTSVKNVAIQACSLSITKVSSSSPLMEIDGGAARYVNPEAKKPWRKLVYRPGGSTKTNIQARDYAGDRKYREMRMICPAARVEGAVPLFVDIVADIIQAAYEDACQ